MGKKTKVGKQRKDKYYQLAKETGYRSRAAFKLIQLNRKFGFLQKSRVCIDLCAAPGGWMQVAQQNMPLSSIVIGVDLFPIKQVPGCISLTQDITTDKCKTAISKEIKTWKADVVLNDGAPNVGQNWLHDAYQQATLTLSALKLATHFLREGGWFVTKVFRSKDYHPLIWVFKQLFKKVHATKPQASRNESSEIFVVCQGYLAPDSIDPKFLDHKYVFEEFEVANKNRFNLLHPEKAKKAKAEGYEENDYTQHHAVPVSHFLSLEDPIDALRGCSQITFDDKSIEDHPRTTSELKECCRDIKVLGRKDLKSLISWLKHMKQFKTAQEAEEKPVQEEVKKSVDADKDDSEKEEDKIDEQIAEIQEEERRQTKRKRKQLNKQRQKLAEKMNLKMVLKGDDGPILESNDMFQLKDIRDANEMKSIIDQQPDIVAEQSDSEDEMKVKAKYMRYNAEDSKLDKSGTYYRDSDSELELETDSESDQEKEGLGFSDSDDDRKKIDKMTKMNTVKNSVQKGDKAKAHPLLTDLEEGDASTRRSIKAELWFQKDSFKALDEDDDEDVDLDKLTITYKKKGKKVSEGASMHSKADPGVGVLKKRKRDSRVSSESDDDSSDSDFDVEETVHGAKGKGVRKEGGGGGTEGAGGAESKSKDGFEVVSQEQDLKRLKRTLKMDSSTLALGSMIASSKKFRRDVKDDAWNRYMFQDTNLPDWFVDDEAKNMRRPVAVPQQEVEEYNKRMQEINARPIKKVIEAKARKKKRAVKKMERAKKKVEAVMDNSDMPEREKAKQVKQLYRKAASDGKKEVKYVVAKKHTTAKRMKRPAGVKGRYRVVDSRMKKDLRAQKAKEKTQGRKKGPTMKKKGKKAK